MIAIISDIHGNYPALIKVLDYIDELGCKEVICLGDTAGYYCMINECIEELRSRNIVSLLGNHDQYLLQGTGCQRSNSANRCLQYQLSVIKDFNRDWLLDASKMLHLGELSFVHGGWNDPIEEYLYSISSDYFDNRLGKFFFSGHTHVQTIADFGEKVYCNPGSVGQPRDGDSRASFATFNKGKIAMHRVEYDIDSIANKMRDNGFEPYIYENLYKGTRIGGEQSKIIIDYK